MGPAATATFLRQVVEETPARRDRDHLHVVVESNPRIPDRIEAILGDGPSPAPDLRRGARRLEEQGATVLAIPSNTPHYFHGDVDDAVGVPVLHIADATVDAATSRIPGATGVGLLATTATVEAGIYRRRLRDHGLGLLTPGDDEQIRVADAIKAVKSGEEAAPRRVFQDVAATLVDRGADAVIAGCTEVPVVLPADEANHPLVDSSRALARAAVHRVREGPPSEPA